MTDDETAERLIDALQDAPSFRLYQMRSLIDTMLADPKRTVAARASLHLGQPVQFIDFRSGQIRQGKLIARHDTQATVIEQGVQRSWKIPYVAIAPADSKPREQAPAYEPPAEPAAPAGTPALRPGDKVTFDDAKGRALVGLIRRVNRRTATLETMDGRTWRVGFELLRHVVEV